MKLSAEEYKKVYKVLHKKFNLYYFYGILYKRHENNTDFPQYMIRLEESDGHLLTMLPKDSYYYYDASNLPISGNISYFLTDQYEIANLIRLNVSSNHIMVDLKDYL